jgi:hypothetical protein
VLPKSNEKLQVKFDGNMKQESLATSQACFNTMTVPAVHQIQFKAMMHKTLGFGARGYYAF